MQKKKNISIEQTLLSFCKRYASHKELPTPQPTCQGHPSKSHRSPTLVTIAS